MDHLPPEGVTEPSLCSLLESHWGLATPSVRYVPKGAGSYHWVASSRTSCHFVTVDDLDAKPWIAGVRADVFDGLRRAYLAARDLRRDHGLAMAVPAVPTTNGELLMKLDDRYTMSVFPFVDGTAGTGSRLDRRLAEELLVGLAALHSVPTGDIDLSPRPYDLYVRGSFDLLPAHLAEPWVAGAFSERARTAVLANVTKLQRWLSELDTLAGNLEASAPRRVVTHGEPHPGNLISTRAGLRLVDWDTAALAPPERDLWMLGAATPWLLTRYEELTRRRPMVDALRFYSLAWTLSDIAYLVESFRVSSTPSSAGRWEFEKLERFLSGAQSTPYEKPDTAAG